MRWTEARQGVRMMKFLSILSRYEAAEFSQLEAAELLGVGERTFRRWRQRDRIIDAMMRLAAANDFRDIGLADVAAEAEVPLSTLRRNFDGKLGILAAFSRRIDEQVLDKGPADGEGARDRLFEVLMRRFEALVPYRDALRRIIRSARRDLRARPWPASDRQAVADVDAGRRRHPQERPGRPARRARSRTRLFRCPLRLPRRR